MNKMRFTYLVITLLMLVGNLFAERNLSEILDIEPNLIDDIAVSDWLHETQCGGAHKVNGVDVVGYPRYKSMWEEGIAGKEDITFKGIFVPLDTTTKLAIFSDDGCKVTITNITTNQKTTFDKYRQGQALPSQNSFDTLSFPDTLIVGNMYAIEVNYSNTCFLGDKDIDGCTLIAYAGRGTLPTFPTVNIDIDGKSSLLIPRDEEKEVNVSLQSGTNILKNVTLGTLELKLNNNGGVAELRENNTLISSNTKIWSPSPGTLTISIVSLKGLKQSSTLNDVQLQLTYKIGDVVIDSKSINVTVNTIPTATSLTVDKIKYSATDIRDIFPGYNDIDIVLSGLDTNETPIGSLSYRITKMPEHGIGFTGINGSGVVNHFHDKDVNNNPLSPSVPVVCYEAQYGWYGTDTFKYVVNDGISDSLEAIVSIIVKPSTAGHFPVADNKSVLCVEDSIDNEISLTGIDNLNHPLKYQIIEGPFHGTLDKRGSDTGNVFKYTPNSKWNGNDYFKYIVKEDITNGLDSITAIVNIFVENINHSPITDNYTISINKNYSQRILLATDSDYDLMTVEYTTQPLHGTITTKDPLYPECIVYTPDVNNNAVQDIIKYKVTDMPPNNLTPITTPEKTIIINLTTGNIPPIANDITESTFAGEVLSFTLPVENIDDDVLTFAVDGNSPIHGVIIFDHEKKSATYTPNISEISIYDTFKYKVTDEHGASSSANINININSHKPVVESKVIEINDITIQTDIIFTVTDTDPCDTVFVFEYSQPHRGSLALINNVVKYTPDTTFTGLTTFQYRAKDEHGIYSDYAIVVLNITLPVAENKAPVAEDIYVEISKCESSRTIILKGSDADNDNIEYEIVENSLSPNYGVLSGITGDKINYIPDFAHLGDYTFTYLAKEVGENGKVSLPGTVTIKVVDFSASIVLLGYQTLNSDVNYNNLSGKVYPALYVDIKPNERIGDANTNLSIQINEIEKNSQDVLWHQPGESRLIISYNLFINKWEWYNTSISRWEKCNITNFPTQYNITGNTVKYRYYINDDQETGIWDTTCKPLGHNGSYTITLSQDINITKDEGNNPPTKYTVSVKGIESSVNNTIISEVSTSNGNVKNDYVKYDPDGWDFHKKPVFKFKINNDGKSHKYICDVFLRPTSALSWSNEQPYITKDIIISNNICTEVILGDDEVINNSSDLNKGTYTFDIYVREVNDFTSRNVIDSEAYKTQYCLSVQDHSVWVDTDSNGVQTLKASYNLNDQGKHNAKEIELVVLDENLNEISVINGQTAINMTHAGNGSGIICHTGGNYDGWRIVFTGGDSIEDDFRNRVHQSPRMLAMNVKKEKSVGITPDFSIKYGSIDVYTMTENPPVTQDIIDRANIYNNDFSISSLYLKVNYALELFFFKSPTAANYLRHYINHPKYNNILSPGKSLSFDIRPVYEKEPALRAYIGNIVWNAVTFSENRITQPIISKVAISTTSSIRYDNTYYPDFKSSLSKTMLYLNGSVTKNNDAYTMNIDIDIDDAYAFKEDSGPNPFGTDKEFLYLEALGLATRFRDHGKYSFQLSWRKGMVTKEIIMKKVDYKFFIDFDYSKPICNINYFNF